MTKRKCRHCGERKPTESGIIQGVMFFCSKEHLIGYATANARELAQKGRAKLDKERRAETRAKKESLRPRSWYLKEAQKWFNKYIRLRDGAEPCISCRRFHDGQYHAGHYRTVAAAPMLRFHEDNCHKQCAPCNNHLSGNLTQYRINLVAKIGLERVEWLEGPHEPAKYTIGDLVEIIDKYKAKCKE